MRGLLISIVKVAVVAYLGYTILLMVVQRRMLFPGSARVSGRDRSAAVPAGVQRVWLDQPAGPVEAWYMASTRREGPGPALVFAHGNAELIDDWTPLAELTGIGVSVLLVEFPGYGHSSGAPSRQSIGEAFRAGYDWLVARADVDPERVVVMGRSIGGGVATDLAASRPVCALILQSTFSSLSRLAWESFRAPGFLLRDRFDNEAVLRSFEGPVLLMHGRRDEIIPVRHTRRLAAVSPGAEVIEWDCGHNDCPPDWHAFIADVKNFLAAHGVIRDRGGG